MKNSVFQTGAKYKLYIDNPKEDKQGRLSFGIKCSEKFDSRANFVAVFITKPMLEEIIKDLQIRLSEM